MMGSKCVMSGYFREISLSFRSICSIEIQVIFANIPFGGRGMGFRDRCFLLLAPSPPISRRRIRHKISRPVRLKTVGDSARHEVPKRNLQQKAMSFTESRLTVQVEVPHSNQQWWYEENCGGIDKVATLTKTLSYTRERKPRRHCGFAPSLFSFPNPIRKIYYSKFNC